MDSGPKIAALILQYGHWQKTLACVRSLLASSLEPRWIIVLDNASPDDSALRIQLALKSLCEEKFPGRPDYFAVARNLAPSPALMAARVILLPLSRNGGYAAGNNAGMQMALGLGADAFLILNNDTTVEPAAVGEMWGRLNSSKRPGLCGALLVYEHGGGVQCLGGGHTSHFTGLSTFSGAGLSLDDAQAARQDEVEKELNFICGACVMVSRAFVEQVGYMDEGYFLYCEEQDWAIRARGRFDFVWAKNAIVHHHEGATTGWSRFDFNWRGAALLARSRLRLTWRHFPQYLPSVVLCMIFAAARIGVRRLASGAKPEKK